MVAPDLSRAAWRKSSRSSASGSNCVEVAAAAPRVAVRDSKNPQGPRLALSARAWDAFTAATRNATFDR